MLRFVMRRGRLCLKEQDGQAMVEFAIVLPLLLLLTVGTILMSVSFIQKSRMNGLSFSAARVQAVRRSDFNATDFVLRDYRDRSGQNWTQQIQVESTDGPGAQVRLSKTAERADVFANLVSGDPSPEQPTRLLVETRMPTEYPASGNLRRQTRNEVNYVMNGIDSLVDSKLNLVIRPLIDQRQMADQAATPEEKDNILGLGPPNRNIQLTYDEFAWGKAYSSHQESVDGSKFDDLQKQYEIFDKILSAGSQDTLDLILDSILPGASLIKKILGGLAEGAISGFQGDFIEAGESLNKANTSFYGGTEGS